jgi:hypothetical protein
MEMENDVVILGTLAEVLQLHCTFGMGTVPESVVAWLVAEMAKTVGCLHKLGVAHNDLGLESFSVARQANGADWTLILTGVGSKSVVQVGDDLKLHFAHDMLSVAFLTWSILMGCWVSTQRSNYRLHRERKPSSMTEEHIRALDGTDLAFTWSVRYQELCDFKVQFGNYLVPNKYSANLKLAQWISTQRTQYRKHHERRRTSMTEERIRDLESIRFDWGTTKTDWASIWSVRFQQLCEFKVKVGVTTWCHLIIMPTPRSGGGFQLSAVTTSCIRKVSQLPWQRSVFESSRVLDSTPMPEERIRELESLGFDSHAMPCSFMLDLSPAMPATIPAWVPDDAEANTT